MSLLEELKRRNVLRVAAAYVAVSWLLIQVVETVFPAFGFGDSAVRIVVILLGIGFVPALVLAWVFELSTEGIKREADVDHSSTASIHGAKRLDRLIMVFLSLAVAYFGVDKFVLDPARDADRERAVAEQARSKAIVGAYDDRSIVVLPFVNLSDDSNNEYFSDGMTEELQKLLATIRELRVISRTSAFSYKGKEVDIPTVASELNVTHVLEGSVRQAGDDLRVTVQLIDARTDNPLWSETYDRTLDDIFAIQDEIAAHVVEELKVRLIDDAPHTVTTDPDAYVLYLQARSLSVLGRLTSEQISYAEELLKQVLEIDRDYVPALNELNRVYYQRMWLNGSLTFDEGQRLMMGLLSRVLAIDPNNAVANASLAYRAMEIDSDLVSSARFIQRALETSPSNEDVLWTAPNILIALARHEEAVALSEYGAARNPLFSGIHNNRITAYYLAGRFEAAIAAARQWALLFPGMRPRAHRMGHSQLMLGDFDGALETFNQVQDEFVRQLGSAKALHSLGRQAEFDEALSYLVQNWGDSKADDIAMVEAWTGDVDSAFDWLGQWFEGQIARNGERWVPGIGSASYVLHDPMFQNLHDDPRWEPLLESKGISHKQLAKIEFEFRLPD